MSLKAFHIFFIAVSMLFTGGFGLWAVAAWRSSGGLLNLSMGVGSLVASVALLVYGFWFLRKLRGVSFL